MPESNESIYGNSIPAAVREASARADLLAREAGSANAPAEAPEEVLPTVGNEAPEAPPPSPPPAPEPPADWEHRYNTLRGKYDAEVPNLRAQLDGVHQLLATMQRPPAPPPEPPPAPREPVKLGATDKDVADYGQDLIESVGRWVQPLVEDRVGEIRRQYDERLKHLTTNVQHVQTATAQERVHDALDRDSIVGDKWRAINNDVVFLDWLTKNDPFTGQKRQDLLHAAYHQGDANRTSAFFRAFLAEQTATTPPAPGPTPQTPDNPAAGRPSLEAFAAPGRPAGSPSVGSAPEKRVWRKDEVSAFYNDKVAGRYRGRETDAARIEQELFDALREGRIR